MLWHGLLFLLRFQARSSARSVCCAQAASLGLPAQPGPSPPPPPSHGPSFLIAHLSGLLEAAVLGTNPPGQTEEENSR